MQTFDLLQFHNVRDPHQSLAQFKDWKAQGVCRYIGITSTRHGDFGAIEAVLLREKPDFVQIDYSLDDREAENTYTTTKMSKPGAMFRAMVVLLHLLVTVQVLLPPVLDQRNGADGHVKQVVGSSGRQSTSTWRPCALTMITMSEASAARPVDLKLTFGPVQVRHDAMDSTAGRAAAAPSSTATSSPVEVAVHRNNGWRHHGLTPSRPVPPGGPDSNTARSSICRPRAASSGAASSNSPHHILASSLRGKSWPSARRTERLRDAAQRAGRPRSSGSTPIDALLRVRAHVQGDDAPTTTGAGNALIAQPLTLGTRQVGDGRRRERAPVRVARREAESATRCSSSGASSRRSSTSRTSPGA